MMLIAMHILRLFKAKQENNVFEEEKFLEQFDTPQIIFFPQLFEQHSSFGDSCRSQFFCNCGVTLVF